MTKKFEDASGLSEAVMRRTDNTMINRKWTKCQTMIYKTLHRNLKIAQEPHYKPRGEFRKENQFLHHYWHISCHSYCKLDDKSLMSKVPDCDYDKRKISVVMCDIYIP